MAKVVPEDEYCGLANEKEIKKFSKSNNSDLNLFDSYKPNVREINEKVLELENSALENKKDN